VGHALEPDLGRDADADPAVLSLHFSLAGDHARAWKYARLGAERASVRFAHADAAELYRRAIESGRRNGAPPAELASSSESLGKALQRTGELRAAAEALTVARRLAGDDPVAHGRLFYFHTVIAERSARLSTAIRWAHRGLRTLEGLDGREPVIWRARTLARLAFYRIRQGRLLEAERLCHQAIAEAEPVGELEAAAFAYYMLDFALFEAGRAEEARFSERALGIYEQLGDLEQQGSVLNNLGIHAAQEWSWGEALELLRRSAECSDRAGIPNGVAETEVNIGEIMSDRGLYDAAASHLRRARRVWSSIGERAGTAYATALLGRLAIRGGGHRDGLELLEQATQELWDLGEQGYAEFAESLLAEAEAFGGDPSRAEALADRLIATTDRTLPLLHRVRAIALVRLGRDGAAEELAQSLALARERRALYDVAAGLDLAEAMSWGNSEHAAERDEILAQLGIESLPMPPLEPTGSRPVPVAAG
jgi:tetratricopeptide (TPR) repeat protein